MRPGSKEQPCPEETNTEHYYCYYFIFVLHIHGVLSFFTDYLFIHFSTNMEKRQQQRQEHGADNNDMGGSISEVFPVSITLRNLFPMVSWQKQQHGFVRKLFSSQELSSIYSTSPSTSMSRLLLHESTLEVYYNDPLSDKEEVIIFKPHKASLHPRWDIHRDQLGAGEFYHLLRIRVVASVALNISKDDNNEGVLIERETLADEPLFVPYSGFPYPNNVLPNWNHHLSAKQQDLTSYHMRRPLPQHVQQIKLISALPPNSLFVECSDGQTYVNSALYDLLIKKDIIVSDLTSSVSSSYNHALNQGDQNQIFSESAFQALDAAATNNSNNAKASTVVNNKKESHHYDGNVYTKEVSARLNQHEMVDYQNRKEDLIKYKNHPETESTQQAGQGQQRQQLATINMLKQQIEFLELFLEKNLEELEQLNNHLLESSLEKAIEEESSIMMMQEQLDDLLNKEIFSLQVAEITLEARQVKLLRQLREIYPIEKISNTSYAIRGLALSLKQQQQQQQMDDVLLVQSCALGYVTHLVTMCSKYLNIPLRYRLLCNSSRSAVVVASVDQPPNHLQAPANVNNVLLLTDNTNNNSTMICDGTTITNSTVVYPLFQEKHYPLQSRDRFDKGIVFLERNIECLLDERCIVYDPKSHMLAKLDLLFEQSIRAGSDLTNATDT